MPQLLLAILLAAGPIDSVLDHAAFSGVVLAGDAKSQTYARVLGVADRAGATPVKLDDRWRWASVTKELTAVLVMQQVEAKKLALDAPVSRYLPALAKTAAGKVTLRQLLRHQSGLPNPDDTAPDAAGVPGFYLAGGPDALTYCAGPKLAEPGGKSFQYNNCDYLILERVLAAAAKKPYAALLQEKIAGPAGLASLSMEGPESVRGYQPDGGTVESLQLSRFGGAGAAIGRAGDLLALDRALLNGKLLGAAATREMWLGDPALGYEALGVWSFTAKLAGCAKPVELIERRGDIGGVQVRNLLAPGLKRALVVFTNDARVDFGELWQGAGLAFELASAAFCS